MNIILDRLSMGFVLVLVFLLPFFFIPVNINFIQFGTSILFALVTISSFIFFGISVLKKGEIGIISKGKLLKPFIFVFVPLSYLISFFVNNPSNYSFFGYIFDATTTGFVILSFMFIFLVSMVFKNKDRVFYGYISVILSSLIFAFITLIRFIFGGDLLSFGIFTDITKSVLGSFNNLGVFFAVSALLSMISLEMIDFSRIMKVLVNICFILSVFFLFVVDFSIAWYCIAIISIVFFIYKIFSNKNNNAYLNYPVWRSYALALFILSIVFITFRYPHDLFVSKFSINSLEVRPSISITYDMFKSSVKSNMFFGSGPNTFMSQWIINKPIDINKTIFWNTDFQYGFGLIPTYILTSGILGLISWILFFFAFVYIGIRSIFNKREDKIDDYLNISSFFVSLFLWIVSFLYIPSLPVFILTLFMTGLFLAHNYIYKQDMDIFVFKEMPKFGFMVSLLFTASVVFLVFIAFGLYKTSYAMFNLQKSLTLVSSGDLDNAEKYIEKSLSKIPYDIYFRSRADISILKINKLLSSNIDKNNIQSAQNTFITELQKAIESSVKAKDRDPKNYINWVYMGNSYSLAVPKAYRIKGAYESALASYNQALTLNPKNPAIPLLIARLELDNENVKKAKEYINQAISKKDNYLDAYYLLAQIQLSENNIKDAIKSVETTVIIEPSNPALLFQLGLLYYNSGNYTNAGSAFARSVQISPEYANARYFLGLSFARLGDFKSAIIQFEEILKTNPDAKEVTSILKSLNAGKSPFEEIKNESNKNLPIKDSN